jgi:hypothetical protein
MSTKCRPTVDDLYDRRYRGNAPESEAMSLDDTAVFEAARQAVTLLKKTFETWVVIGKAVVRARDIADRRGGGKTFMRLIEQQGLGRIVNKTTASNLLRIMERLPEVVAWHAVLTERQQIDWAAPTTVIKHCPAFAQPRLQGPRPPTRAEQDRVALAAAIEENERLKRSRDDERFTPTDTADNVAEAIVGMFTAGKASAIAKRILALVKERSKVAAS